MTLALKNEWAMFGGSVRQYTHKSSATRTEMQFTVFLPPGASADRPAPAVYWLSGLTCTDDNFTQKAGAQRYAAEHGVALVAPDTSPRGAGVDGEDESWDFGTGAGFYVDATVPKWAQNYRMYTYVTKELPAEVEAHLPVARGPRGVMGHSMGGHGALTAAMLDEDGVYASVSAFAPVCHPTQCPWGRKAFEGYLGSAGAGAGHDACELMRSRGPFPRLGEILIDQGADDTFLTGDVNQLRPADFEAACKEKGQPLDLRYSPGDHSYFFVASHVGRHIAFHAAALRRRAAAAAPARLGDSVAARLRLDGRTALVTGGSKGLGLAMATGLAEAGAHVVLNSRHEEDLQRSVAGLKARGLSASYAVFDVTDEAAIVAGVARVAAERRRIDILLNNAGGTRRSPFLESTAQDLDFVISLNLRGPYLVAREVGKVMKAQGYGRIVNTGSLMSVQARATIQPYNATKYAINGLTKGLAVELGPHGITCNAIGPGYFATELTRPLVENEKFNRCVTTRAPVGRWGDPSDLAGAAVFLSSDAASYVNGHLLMVDGGMTTSFCDSLLP